MTVMTTPWQPAPYRADKPIFAIGDTHGFLNHLRQLHEVIDARLPEIGEAHVVHLGDYIDRGPLSLETLMEVFQWEREGVEHHILPGNHEQMMLLFMNNPKAFGDWWLKNGGYETVEHFGHFQRIYVTMYEKYGWIDKLKIVLDPIMNRLLNLPSGVRLGNYLFVHAGIPVGMTAKDVVDFKWLETMADNHPLWIRYEFLDDMRPRDVCVVHGHTPTQGYPEVFPTRINIDTGSYNTGMVTMVEIVEDQMRFHIADTNIPQHILNIPTPIR